MTAELVLRNGTFVDGEAYVARRYTPFVTP
jgi:hypothetical protein